MKKQISATPIVAVALVIVAAVGYFMLLKPKSDEAGRLAAEAADLQIKVDTAQAAERARENPGPAQDESAIRAADLFRLTRAMPNDADMPGIILELESVALAAGVEFSSLTPGAVTVRSSYSALPISITFNGNYFDLTDFLFRLRNLVRVRDGRLESDGRLFTLESLDLREGPAGFPQITATVTLTGYLFSTTPAGTTPAPAGTDTTTSESSAAAAGGTG